MTFSAYPSDVKSAYILLIYSLHSIINNKQTFSCLIFLLALTCTGQAQNSMCAFPWTTPDFTVSDEVVDYESDVIDISCSIDVCASLTLSGVGSMEDSDYLNVYYRLDGGPLIPISENVNSFAEKTVQACDISGSTLVIVVQAATSVATETYFISDIIVDGMLNDCLTALFETQNQVIDESISVQQMIETNGVVIDGSIIEYTALDFISMNPNFLVELGADFHAYIDSCGILLGDNTITIQEYESGFCSLDGVVDNNYSGFSGTGFSNTTDSLGAGVDYEIDGSAGSYVFTWRYASTSDRPAKLLVDGIVVDDNIEFLSTGDWTNWNTISVNVALPAGPKQIRLESNNNDGLANIDNLEVSGVNVSAVTCAIGVEDCSALNSAFTLSQTNPGCSNDDGTITVTFENASTQSQIQLSLDGGDTFPITISDNAGSYTFTGLSNGQYEIAAQYGAECFFNVGHMLLIEDCGTISLEPRPNWLDSYGANGFCWCTTNFDHDLDEKTIAINGSQFSLVDVCDELEQHPLFRSRNSGDIVYNDVQCGHGPLNNSSDEPICPGRVDIGVEGCLETGPFWDMNWLSERDRFQVNNVVAPISTKR